MQQFIFGCLLQIPKYYFKKEDAPKKVFPGLWDISVAGHVGAGEGILTAAKREVFEEIGLQLADADFTKIATRKHQISPSKWNYRQRVSPSICCGIENSFNGINASRNRSRCYRIV